MTIETNNESTSFGPIHIVEPLSQHTHTAILLHGRGSDGDEFAEELFESRLSDGRTLAQRLPNWRWVLPSSRELWSTAFEEEMPAWFEAHSLTDPTARQELQVSGLRESANHLGGVLDAEVATLGGKAERVVLGGISQGAAVGLWTLLQGHRRVGAFVGASTWLPFAENINVLFGGVGGRDSREAETEGDAFVADAMALLRSSSDSDTFLSTPVFLGHGTDDAYVDVELGRQARDVLGRIGLAVEWKEYSGAEQEGHWFKEPEELDDIASFVARVEE